ncbi:MAG: hypothetical protein QM796_04010 [Chthoniobacteraceae bacterium]
MKAGKVVLLEAARLQQNHRQRIAEHEHIRGAGGGGEIERAGLALDAHVEMHVAVFREEGLRIAGHGHDLYVETGERGENIHQFIRLAAVAEGEHHIPIGHHTEIAVEGVEGVEHHRRRAGYW